MISAAILNEVRRAAKTVAQEERPTFLRLVVNSPGPGGPILHPGRNGFTNLEELFGDSGSINMELANLAKAATRYRSRESMFQEMISVVHRLAPNFHVYIGRSFLRDGEEHKGPRARFGHHYRNRGMEWGMVFAKVERANIIADEEMAIKLVDLWDKIGVLCCNNTCMLSSGGLSTDPLQLIYFCLQEKTASEKIQYERFKEVQISDLEDSEEQDEGAEGSGEDKGPVKSCKRAGCTFRSYPGNYGFCRRHR